MQFRPEHIYTFIAFVSSILGMWSTLSAKMTKQENRSTVLEKDIEVANVSYPKTALSAYYDQNF